MKIDVCFTPAELAGVQLPKKTAAVIDVLRATTTMVTAVAAGARSIESMLFGITPLDPPTFIAVAAGFTIVAALASYFPARHATRVDPAVTLRDE